MTIAEIIDGLKFTVDMFLFDPSTGETYTEPRNDMDKTTVDACKGAITLLEQARWIPVSEGLPENGKNVLVTVSYFDDGAKVRISENDKYGFLCGNVSAWMPLPEPYEPQEGSEKE